MPRTTEQQAKVNAAARAKYAANREAVLAKCYAYRQTRNWKDVQRRANIKHRYGLSWERYQEMLAVQGGCCAICGEATGKLDVDHDHDSGQIRALLCHPCNLMVGNCRESIAILYGA